MKSKTKLIDFEIKFKMHINNQAVLKACMNYFVEQTNEADRIMNRNVYWLIERAISDEIKEIQRHEALQALLNRKRPIQ